MSAFYGPRSLRLAELTLEGLPPHIESVKEAGWHWRPARQAWVLLLPPLPDIVASLRAGDMSYLRDHRGLWRGCRVTLREPGGEAVVVWRG